MTCYRHNILSSYHHIRTKKIPLKHYSKVVGLILNTFSLTPSNFCPTGVAWDPGSVEEQLCVGIAPTDGGVHVQHRWPGRTDSHATAARDGRDHRAASVHAVKDVPANRHGHAVHQLPGLGGGAHRRHHRPASGHHATPLFR